MARKIVAGAPSVFLVGCMLVVSCFLAGCGALSGRSADDTAVACDDLPLSDPPEWMDHEMSEPGYFFGKGSAGRTGSFDDQVSQAREAALGALSMSVRAFVQSADNSGQRLQVIDGVEHATYVPSDVLYVSSLTLEKVTEDGQWMDRNSCTLWVRLRLNESTLRHDRLLDLIAHSGDTGRTFPDRRRAVEAAKAQVPRIDFDVVAGSETADFYLDQIKKSKAALDEVSSEFLTIVLVDKRLPADLSRDFALGVPGGRLFKHLKRAVCNRLDTCVKIAEAQGARFLLFGRLGQAVAPGSMGGVSGTLTVELTLVDVFAQKPVWGPTRVDETLLTFGTYSESDWKEAARKATDSFVFRPLSACLSLVVQDKPCS